MSNVSAGDIFSGGGLPFVNKELKQRLAKAKAPLAIVGASPKSRNNFGDDETGFTIRVTDKTAKAMKDAELAGDYKLTLSHNEVREDQANAVLERLASGATSIGPVYLCQISTKSGNTAWALSGEPGDGKAEDVAFEGGGSNTETVVDPEPEGDDADDELPF